MLRTIAALICALIGALIASVPFFGYLWLGADNETLFEAVRGGLHGPQNEVFRGAMVVVSIIAGLVSAIACGIIGDINADNRKERQKQEAQIRENRRVRSHEIRRRTMEIEANEASLRKDLEKAEEQIEEYEERLEELEGQVAWYQNKYGSAPLPEKATATDDDECDEDEDEDAEEGNPENEDAAAETKGPVESSVDSLMKSADEMFAKANAHFNKMRSDMERVFAKLEKR